MRAAAGVLLLCCLGPSATTTGQTCLSSAFPPAVVPGCVCHDSCAACGFYPDAAAVTDAEPPRGTCLACADGGPVTIATPDGAGYCRTAPSDATSPAPTPATSSERVLVAAGYTTRISIGPSAEEFVHFHASWAFQRALSVATAHLPDPLGPALAGATFSVTAVRDVGDGGGRNIAVTWDMRLPLAAEDDPTAVFLSALSLASALQSVEGRTGASRALRHEAAVDGLSMLLSSIVEAVLPPLGRRLEWPTDGDGGTATMSAPEDEAAAAAEDRLTNAPAWLLFACIGALGLCVVGMVLANRTRRDRALRRELADALTRSFQAVDDGPDAAALGLGDDYEWRGGASSRRTTRADRAGGGGGGSGWLAPLVDDGPPLLGPGDEDGVQMA